MDNIKEEKECNTCILHDEDKKGNEKLFWELINKEIDSKNETREEWSSIDKKNKLMFYTYYFYNIKFPEINEFKFENLAEDKNIFFEDCDFLNNVDFINLTEAKDIYFKDCTFHQDVLFEKLEFEKFFIFENCTINKNITFQNMTFTKTTSFIKTKFLGEFNLIHTRFDDLALFNEAKIKKLRLDNTFFNEEVSFLGITVDELDRETARIIKHSFEKQGNIIESNKFYAKEMEEQEKELTWKDDFSKKLVFMAHKISSNHSQDWVLALMWIINLSILVTHFDFFIIGDRTEYYIIPFILNIILTIMIVFDFNNFIKLIWTFLSYLIYIYITSDFFLEYVVNSFNPFKKITDITLLELFFKVIIAYLIYQLILSIRQNTRRQ